MNRTKIDLNPEMIYSAGVMAIKANALAAYRRVTPRILKMRKAGLTLAQIAATLNEAGEVTRGGSRYYGDTVRRILKRSAGVPAK
jgi:Recombinase